jgi:hypothetical protein
MKITFKGHEDSVIEIDNENVTVPFVNIHFKKADLDISMICNRHELIKALGAF